MAIRRLEPFEVIKILTERIKTPHGEIRLSQDEADDIAELLRELEVLRKKKNRLWRGICTK